MSDAKPYTVDELVYWESMSEALPVNHRAKLRATVEALESARAERDEAQGIARESMCRFDELYAVLQEVKSMRALAEKERDGLREKQAAWLASPEAAKRLDGYRELGAKCAQLEQERDEARAALAHADTGHMRRVCERDEARAERDEAVRLRDKLLDREKDYLYDIEKAEKERDEARTMHDLMAAEKERAEHAHNELVLSLPAMRRDTAEKQREACADWLEDTVWPEAAYAVVAECRKAPLVTDSTEREVES